VGYTLNPYKKGRDIDREREEMGWIERRGQEVRMGLEIEVKRREG
jgi:hypothetical protein